MENSIIALINGLFVLSIATTIISIILFTALRRIKNLERKMGRIAVLDIIHEDEERPDSLAWAKGQIKKEQIASYFDRKMDL